MRKELKKDIIDSLTNSINEYKHVYITDIAELDAESTYALRKACFTKQVKLIQVKNTLLKLALEQAEGEYTELLDVLKGSSSIMLSDTGNAPAKVIKEIRAKQDKPILKAAYVEESIYIGDSELDNLVNIKSKEELLGDIVSLLQSPIKNVISSLESGKNTLSGIVKTLSEKE
ncbi:MAG: 50S ribosomal protein L10 [Marinifilaceae bacterium]|jgi:large subunit ribosomal protein L10|nr:50S ribosomal protein L10 [Marinilabiliaceae bacterium JC040]MCT4599364.1 50S ribosomal protein L10 [Marinifilaceae bacterium]